jgi:hypothetical protein
MVADWTFRGFHDAERPGHPAATVSPMHEEAFTKMSVDGFTSQLAKLDKRFVSAE